MRLIPAALLALTALPLQAQSDFVNFETPPVHPLDLSPDGARLAASHTADGRVEIFTFSAAGALTPEVSIPVGVDPVSVRWRTANELWVVNHLSDTVSVVDVAARTVKATLATDDEPCDVVFAGAAPRAWVSCSQPSTVLVFNPADLAAPPDRLSILGEDPRAMAVSPDGLKVYAGIFESGNGSTILGGGGDSSTINFPPNAVGDAAGPYGGVNPPPNNGSLFNPPRNAGAGTPPKVGLIVKKDAAGLWRDDNNINWTSIVSGPQAAKSGRPQGWDVIDNDIAIIDTATSGITYATRMMNLVMAIGVNPASGRVTVVGTEGTNEIRFEPVVNGKFLRVLMGRFDAATPAATATADLNPHLNYAAATVAQAERDKSLGDPRAVAWRSSGNRGYVAGMGSNNLAVIDANGVRIKAAPVPVGQGPSGLAVDEARGKLYVFHRFDASIGVVDLTTETLVSTTPLFDPTPAAIRTGRPLLFDTHRTSGLGHVSCASCHIDARMDRLAWDLGDPSGAVKNVTASLHNRGAGIPGLDPTGPISTQTYTNFHPMKGPMTTQTLVDIVGKEPHHWRGDRNGLEEFNGAFGSLLGDDVLLTPAEMQQFENYLASLYFPPNPFRNTDNTLPADLPLPGHYRSGRFGNAGQPLPNGNAQRGLNAIYRPLSRAIDQGAFACATCHTLPTGLGTDRVMNIFTQSSTPIAAGPNGERHHMMVSVDGSSQRSIKVPQTRNLYDKTGFETTQLVSRAGFGFAHDGSVDSLSRFFSEGAFSPASDQDIADIVALMLAFSGSEFGAAPDGGLEPPGTESKDSHAATGRQATLTSASAPASAAALLAQLVTLTNAQKIDLTAHASINGAPRGWQLVSGSWQSDEQSVTETLAAILARASASAPVTFTAVTRGVGRRTGIERDRDNMLDYDEVRDLAPGVPGVQNPFDPARTDSTGNNGTMTPDGTVDGLNDFDNDGATNAAEFTAGTNPADQLAQNPPLNLVVHHAANSVTLQWQAAPLGQYEASWSADLMAWTVAKTMTAGAAGGSLSWTDTGPPDTPSAPFSNQRRFYRVERVR